VRLGRRRFLQAERRRLLGEARDHRRVIRGSDVGEHAALGRRLGKLLAGQHVVDAPADVALAQVAPRRPPGEERVVVRVEGAADVDQAVADQPVSSSARSSGRVPMTCGLRSLGWMSRSVRATLRSPQTRSARPARRTSPAQIPECGEEVELGLVVLAAVRHVDRGDEQVAEVGGDDAVLVIEMRVGEAGWASANRAARPVRPTCSPTPE
jgi:hypothetical protein